MTGSHKMDDRLSRLRQAIATNGLSGWIIGREDMFQGEEVPAGDERLAFISGFTGSAGFAVVTADCAVLFSDGRYSLQMQAQANPAHWQCRTLPEESFEAWLGGLDLGDDWTIGIDDRLVTLDGYEKFERAILNAGGKLASHSKNLVDQIWTERPGLAPATPWLMPDAITGRPMSEKLAALDEVLLAKSCAGILLTRVDAVNWLINQRGTDLNFTPVNLCFAFYTLQGDLNLLGDHHRLSALKDEAISISSLDQLPHLLADLGDAAVMIEPASLPHSLFSMISASTVQVVKDACPVTRMKAHKTGAELDGFRAAHQRDGVAMVEFLCWLQQNMKSGLGECKIAEQLLVFRQQQDGFIAPSFATIAGSGPNGAIVHYRAIDGADRCLKRNDLLLLDSGAHYKDGTTDITRTIAIGDPPEGAAAAFTRVLKAHINLALAVFPKGTTGQQLDVLARAPLWAAKMDFEHGTGHGVGHVLSVHEGPVSISKRGEVPLDAGMVLSNEPGYYKAGAWGIRIENLVLVKVLSDQDFLALETLTMCPIDRQLILKDLLDQREINWVNAYHQLVKETLYHGCSNAAKAWLEVATAPI